MPVLWTAVLWQDDIDKVEHTQLGLARLVWQYRGSQSRVQGLLETYLDGLQMIEDTAYDVHVGRWPLTAIGEQLDVIGRVVGQPRNGLIDDQYRLLILGRILVNRSNGTIPEAFAILAAVGVTETIHAAVFHPDEVELSITGVEYGNIIGELMQDWMSGGFRLHWVWSDEKEADTFAFSDTLGADEINASGGFGDIGGVLQTTGGYMSGGTET